MKVLTVIGARPQFIKASVVTAEFKKQHSIEEVVVHTGQHFDLNMSDVFFSELDIPVPRYQLEIHGGNHGEMTGRMLTGIERVMLEEQPDITLVYGDTNSTLAGALAAAKLHVPVAHVEAGLRSFNMRMPEEINRILTDRVSTWLFVPTKVAVTNLEREGIGSAQIRNVGDVMYDVALHHGKRASRSSGDILDQLGLNGKGYVLVTVHRAENTDDPERIGVIVEALINIGRQIPVIWPLHPRTRATLERMGMLKGLDAAIQLLEPLGYLDMVRLECSASVIATDSGGVQKEAYFHGVPCVTLRDETEWVELVDAHWNRLAPPNDARIVIEAIFAARGQLGEPISPYGTGNAAKRIVDCLSTQLLRT